ncbi:MAG TPA: S46 family peptidase [Bacteroidales bacterium]|nr:S46 family peptidase [Bacteroidales bacterium]
MSKLKLLLAFAAISLLPVKGMAIEGMWLPLLINQNLEEMQKMGLTLSAEDLYSPYPDSVSLNDGIVRFGRGCTGFFISPEGLLITNHHCGLGQIQQHSTVENDYLTNGFWAQNRSDELPNPGLTVTLLVRMEDVTHKIVPQLSDTLTEQERTKAVMRISSEIAANANPYGKYEVQVLPLFNGNKYVLYVNQVFSDVRLVGAPPNSIGKFGGDEDNWMWPRHTGDFALFRVYANANNEPAGFSPDNQPYRPAHFFPVANRGVQENEFTMVYGYPGRTTQYLTSYAVEFIKTNRNPIAIDLRTRILEIYNQDMAASDRVRIQYTAKRARVSNTWKRWQGENRGLLSLQAVNRKRQSENSFQNWANLPGNEEFRNLMQGFGQTYQQLIPYRHAANLYNEAGRGVEVVRFAQGFEELIRLSRDPNTPEATLQSIVNRLKEQARAFFRDYNPDTDRRVLEVLLERYLELAVEPLIPSVLREVQRRHGNDLHRYAQRLFENSIFVSENKTMELLEGFRPADIRRIERDPAWQLAYGLLQFNNEQLRPFEQRYEARLDSLYRIYIAGLKIKYHDMKFYPDANGTLRITYGRVEGTYPRDAMAFLHKSTSDGILEKALNPYIPDYQISDRLEQLLETRNFGQYEYEGDLIVNFIASNHTTGGNSGSPVIDARGAFIGINFDRTWESTMSDIIYDVDICRNISVSSQFILWVIEKYAGMRHLINEMVVIN